jgi:D-alanine--poly(phosphoribitol) ligase subunit 1
LNSKIPSYMIPTKFKFVGNFPLNNNGKIDRKLLIQHFQDSQVHI